MLYIFYVAEGGQWGWWLLQIGTPVILLIGITGNVLSLLVMKSRRLRSKSYSHYLCSLAIFDSLVLLSKYIERLDSLLLAVGHTGVFCSFGDVACKIFNFTQHVCYLMSTWLVLCITLERFVAVFFPFKKVTLCKPRRALTVILSLFAFMSYSQIFRLIVIEKTGPVCSSAKKYLKIYIAMHIYLYQLVLLFSLPAVIILVCNMMILCKIMKLRRDVLKQGSQHAIRIYAKRHKTTCMLLVVSFCYMVTIFPLLLISIIVHIVGSIYSRSQFMSLYFRLNKVLPFFEFLSECNYGVNFFIYVLSGQSFRYELKRICLRKYTYIPNPAHDIMYQFKKTDSKASA